MPADDVADKTEDPTPRRIQEAREKGQVAKSVDISAAFGLLAGMVMLNWYGPTIFQGMASLMEKSLSLDNVPTNGTLALDASWRTLLSHTALMPIPFFLALVVVAIVTNLAQVGFLLTGKPITPSLEKISPLKGLERLFSKRTAIKLITNLSKVGIIATVAYFTIKSFLPRLVGLPGSSFIEVVGHAMELVFILGLRMVAVLVILALVAFAVQKRQLWLDLRMSKQEVKEELKRMEGDPLMRQRRLNVARQLAASRMSQAVPQADVVVTNPTELAIALKYDHDKMHAPKVVAKGAGYMAQRIRQIANENGVPIIERKPLAQALYKSCEIGDFVPPELYKAVAEVLAYIFELAGKGYRRVATG